MAIAYFSTWTTYGTWLPGDERGWFHHGRIWDPHELLRLESSLRMASGAVILNPEQRATVEQTIAEDCRIRNWSCHAVNCRSNHVHVVVTAIDREVNKPREQFKSWCCRKLNEHAKNTGIDPRANWWTQRGWDLFIDHQLSLAAAVAYVQEGQDFTRR